MRYGFTTGSCAAAAAKAAAYMLLSGREKTEIEIDTPKGIVYHAQIEEICRGEREVSCGVRKDGGDDPDVTTGSLVCATVRAEEVFGLGGAGRAERKSDTVAEPEIEPQIEPQIAASVEIQSGTSTENQNNKSAAPKDGKKRFADKVQIHIDGGIGVGRVTKPGLDQPVGNAAINHVPRKMIEKEVAEVCALFDYQGQMTVEIFVPDGEALAGKTFNPRLGIEGGISILGTTGIVEPMSEQALLDTIRVELRQKRAQGYDTAYLSPGNYGLEFMKKNYGYDLEQSVKCSNYIGATLDMVVELGFRQVLLTGHIGKLVKVAGGIMNTHSKEADCRMELLAAAAIREGADTDVLKRILDCISTEEAIEVLDQAGIREPVMQRILNQILFYLGQRVKGEIQVECILYANAFGELAKSAGAARLLAL
ncbi:MAG: cobalamin biosynthesis protein CbiD [Lachnospiraceae bacterium]|nr:cobalamin biosynthesis protein CbiD [Lachnospiraceae bacterium]